METAKWLEHHFGSESTRSSTGNLSEEDEKDEEEIGGRGRQKTTSSNSFINVTMKSAETPADGYFKGVSEWKTKDSPPVRPPIRRKRDLQKTTSATTATEMAAAENDVNELESLPLFNSVQQRVQGYEMAKEKLSGRNATNGYHHRSHYNGHEQVRRV